MPRRDPVKRLAYQRAYIDRIITANDGANPRMCCKCRTSPRRGRSFYCTDCNTAVSRSWQKRNPDKVKQYTEKAKNKRKARQWLIVVEYLRSHPCVDCGEVNIVLLEFDHVRGVKKCSVGSLINGSQADKAILGEIAKCDVVCVRCHRYRTVRRAIGDPGSNGRWSGGRYAHLTPTELMAVQRGIVAALDISRDEPT